MEWNATAVATTLIDIAPANRALGVRVFAADGGQATATLDATTPTGDGSGVVSAAAITALVQAAAQAAVISAAEEAAQVHHARATSTTLELALLAPARGRLTASCLLVADDVDVAQAVYAGAIDAVSVTAEVTVHDASGWLVSSARTEWLVERTEVAAPSAVDAPRRARRFALVSS